MPYIYTVKSDKDSHFTGALLQDAEEQENIVLNGSLAGIRGDARSIMRSISILSDENLAWEIFLWMKDTFHTTDLDLDAFAGRWRWDAGDGVQIAATGKYFYYIDGLAVPYEDQDRTGELHMSLVNRSAGAKTAGANGEIVVAVTLEPMELT